MSARILADLSEGVLTIRLNRAEKKNALSRDMYGAMTQALRRAEAEEAVRAVLFLGAPGAFCAGNDIADFAAMGAGGDLPTELPAFLHALAGAPKPVVAGVDGLAIGIGTTLLLHCDLAYATPASRFRTPFLDLGVTPEAGSSLLAPRLMGQQRAFALLAMGEAFTAQEAREAGFVYRVADDAEGAAREAALRLAGKPREALAVARRLLRGETAAIQARIDEEIALFAERLRSQEARAAFAAFLSR